MNKTYLFVIASILAIASLISGTSSIAVMAQTPNTSSDGGMGGSPMNTSSSNMTGTQGGNATGAGNSTTPQ